MKIVVSDKKSGRTAQFELAKDKESAVVGKKIGDIVEGAVITLDGYRMQITGMSDYTGSPSRKEVEGSRKVYVLLSTGPGIARMKKGKRVRKLVRGNTVSTETGQVNTVITEYGGKSVDELFPKKPAAAEKAQEAK